MFQKYNEKYCFIDFEVKQESYYPLFKLFA